MADASDALTIRTMTRDEVDLAVAWAAREGWNPGLRDAGCFHAADPGGFLLGLYRGRPAVTISAVRYGDAYAFVGFYIAAPEYRGRGLGFAVWQRAFEGLSRRTVGLDGVVGQQANYAKTGFVLAHRNVRYGGEPPARPVAPTIRALVDADWGAVEAYDRAHFPAPRRAFLQAWLSASGHRVLGCFDGSDLRGYGVVRPCREGAKIGPLFADRAEIAADLFDGLAAAEPARPLFLDVPEPNAAAVELTVSRDLAPVFETARMYRGVAPELPLARIFGITSFELG